MNSLFTALWTGGIIALTVLITGGALDAMDKLEKSKRPTPLQEANREIYVLNHALKTCERAGDLALKNERQCRQQLVQCRDDMTNMAVQYGIACESNLCIEE